MTRLAEPWEQTLYPDLRPQEWGWPCPVGQQGQRATIQWPSSGTQGPLSDFQFSHKPFSALISSSEKWER